MRIEAKRGSSKSGLFLMELMIAILFFSLASAVCVQIFATANLTSAASGELNMATLHAQSAAEVFKGTDGKPAQMAEQLDGMVEPGNSVVVRYDRDWNAGAGDQYAYLLRISAAEGLPATVQITVEKQNGETIFAITAKDYW